MLATVEPPISQKDTDRFYSIEAIASWQLNSAIGNVELPTLQRTFVWKPNQVEELWDSLLRGFPIGSVLLSRSGDKLYLLDGQQRATALALGYYDPWSIEQNTKFWSLKNVNVPALWIDLAPQKKPVGQRFVPRVVTRSHPWGYQSMNNRLALGIADRRAALDIFKTVPRNAQESYTTFSISNVFPYDSDMPVPMAFLLEAVAKDKSNWKNALLAKCKDLLPIKYIRTRGCKEDYLSKLEQILDTTDLTELVNSIERLKSFRVPAIIVENEILQNEDETDKEGSDPTLFVRLNSSGTHIGGEELIYSIYKAIFPDSKKLVEQIGNDLIAPPLVISLVARLANCELNDGHYPAPISVNDFRRRIRNADFKDKIEELIGNDIESPVKQLFNNAINILKGTTTTAELPLVLLRKIISSSPELFLMLLWWLRANARTITYREHRAILGSITAIRLFCKDTKKYVRQVWPLINKDHFWNKEIFSRPNLRTNYLMPYLVQPEELHNFLIKAVVKDHIQWNDLYPKEESGLHQSYRAIIGMNGQDPNIHIGHINDMWDNFINRLVGNRSLLLFSQRKYIKEKFKDYDQYESLEDTNVPWDWDHIYPSEWVNGKWYIDQIMRHWNNSIGNLRALSLDQNRSERNDLSPQKRLEECHDESFIKDSDWLFWQKITGRINKDNKGMVECHLSAVITRLCNIYEDWYNTLNIGQLFDDGENRS